MQNLVGQTLDDKYSIQKEIGRGGMGAVYYAVHLGTKRPVAVKVIVPHFSGRAEFIERFRREAEAAGRLVHPNVVNVTDFGFAQTNAGRVVYLVMEYLSGCTLSEVLLEEKKMSLLWTVDILEQVSSAVAEAHRLGIIHRDLKPDNIWLEPNQRGGYTAKVLDFGIVQLTTRQTGDDSNYFNEREFEIEDEKITASATEIYSITGSGAQATEIIDQQQILLPPDSLSPEQRQINYETFIDFSNRAIPKPNNQSLEKQPKPTLSQIEEAEGNRQVKNHSEHRETDGKNFDQKTTAQLTRAGTILGTPLYMSPEQCRGQRLGTSSDIYSLGVIAYQMLSGSPPFVGADISVMSGHLQFAPPPLPVRKIPRKVKKVIYRALEKEPINRPPSAEIFAGQMRSYSENIFTIARRAVVIYFENLSKLIWFSLLFYFPTIMLGGLMFVTSIAEFNNLLGAKTSSMILTAFKTLNITIGICAETLVSAAVAWMVIQYIDAPLRSFSIIYALRALFGKWKQFAWILPLRVLVNFFIQGDLTAFSPILIFILSLIDSIVFWAVPCVVMMENLQGFNIIKRGSQLTLKAVSTVIAALGLNLLIFIIVGITATIVFISLASYTAQNFIPAVADLSWQDFYKLTEGLTLSVVKFVSTFILPFFAVMTTLIYLKTRQAGGESTKSLLNEFKKSDVLQSNWQRRIQQRFHGRTV